MEILEKIRFDFVEAQTQKVFEESGVLNVLDEFSDVLAGSSGAALIYSPRTGTATLLWQDKKVMVTVNPDTEQLTISGKNDHGFDKTQLQDKGEVRRALLVALINPTIVEVVK